MLELLSFLLLAGLDLSPLTQGYGHVDAAFRQDTTHFVPLASRYDGLTIEVGQILSQLHS